MKMFSIACCFFLFTSLCYNQSSTLKGRILDNSNGTGLPAATIRIENSSRGTISNMNGDFSLTIQDGPLTINVSYLGYLSKTLSLIAPYDSILIIKMEQAPVELPVVTVTSEDPAYEIIRKAISSKNKWRAILHNYSFDAFTRAVISRDTAVAMIVESYSTGYWRDGDTLRAVVKQKRQTQNIPISDNLITVRGITNFSDDTIHFAGYTCVGPLADNAFDYYTYTLIQTGKQKEKETYEISMQPKTKLTPLFRGKIYIADGFFALIGVDFQPNEAISFPFMSSFSLHLNQRYDLFDERFWLPVDIEVKGSFTIKLPGLTIPTIGLQQTSSIYDYSINREIADSIFHRPCLVTDSSAVKYDSTFWKTNVVLPLTPREETAYKSIDSTQTMDVQFKPHGILASLNSSEGIMKYLSFLDLRFNRVEGFYSGIDGPIDIFRKRLTLNTHVGYSFFQKQIQYDGSIEYAFDTTAQWSIGTGWHRRVAYTGTETYGTFENSLACLLDKNDFYDYYKTEGWKIWGHNHFNDVDLKLTYLDELQNSIQQTTNYSWFARERSYRAEPLINDGHLRSISLSGYYGPDDRGLASLQTGMMLEFTAEFSPKKVLSSTFDYSQYSFSGRYDIVTFGKSFLFKPFLRLYAQGGVSFGTTPFQKLFILESQLSGLSAGNVLRTSEPREFYGDKYLIFSVEHNFRTLPFLALGIPFLYEKNYELIVHTTFARSWFSSQTIQNLPVIPHTTDGWFVEYGFGLSRILEFLRMDLTWRYGEKSKSGPVFTLGIATIF